MDYRVIVQATAQRDATDYAAYILRESQTDAPAKRWLLELELAVNALATMPRRFPKIPEQDSFSIELRQFIFHSHRVIYHVIDETRTVHVLRIYHGRRDRLTSDSI